MSVTWNEVGKITSSSDDREVRVYPPIMDKISITFDIPREYQDEVRGRFFPGSDRIYNKKLSLSVPRRWLPYAPSELAALTQAFIQVDPKAAAFGSVGHIPFAKITFNPSKVKNIYDLKHKIDTVMPNGYGWDHIIQTGTVTRIDITVDVTNVSVDDLLLTNKYTQLSGVYCKKGKTFRFGTYSSGKEMIAYDKVAQIREQNSRAVYQKRKEPLPDVPVTRIEMQLNKNKSTFRGSQVIDLLDLQNPFQNMTVAFQSHPDDIDLEGWVWKAFLSLARLAGAQAALPIFPIQYRSKIVARMKLSVPEWWMPEISWQGYPRLVHRLLKSANMDLISAEPVAQQSRGQRHPRAA